MSIFPECFKADGNWSLAKERRMDRVAVLEGGRIQVRGSRLLKAGEPVAVGRTEDGRESLCARGIVSNVQDFIVILSKGPGVF